MNVGGHMHCQAAAWLSMSCSEHESASWKHESGC
jgi:hypothetical protein